MHLPPSIEKLPTPVKVIVPVAGGVLLLGWWRKRQAAKSGAPTATNGIDPATGAPYSQEEAAYLDQGSNGLGNSYDPSQFYGPSSGGSSSGGSTATTTSTTGTTTAPASPPIIGSANLARIATPVQSKAIASTGARVYSLDGTQYWDPQQLLHISTPAEASALSHQGYRVVALGNGEFFNPAQVVKSPVRK